MTVNDRTLGAMALLIVIAAVLSGGCGGPAAPPVVTYLSAAARLNAAGESRRLDVAVDVRNPGKQAYENLKLVVTFMDHTEAVFEWPALPPYGLQGGQAAVEVKLPITSSDMLGGSFEPITDPAGFTTQYATEIKGAVLSYKDQGGPSHDVEVGMALSRTIRESFEALSTGEVRRLHDRDARLNELKARAATVGVGE